MKSTLRLDQLVERADNPNKMEPNRLAMLVDSIRANGFLQPILVAPTGDPDKFTIVDGHHRVRAAREVGLVEVSVVSHDLTEWEARAMQVGMNRLRGDLDLGMVGAFFAEADLAGELDGLPTTGFTEDEVSDLLASVRGTSDDDVLAGTNPLDEAAPKPVEHVMELEFSSLALLREVKKKLRRAAKPTGLPLGDALAQLLAGEGGPDDGE
jgi:hypothetical protein